MIQFHAMKSEKEYRKRILDAILERKLAGAGAVLVEGPKWCGKSTTASRYAKTLIDLMPLESREDYINLAKISPSSLLNYGPKPILIDEWQHISFICDQVKYEVDRTGEFGQYILTGSVTDKCLSGSDDENSRHTGNGRIIRKMMRTLSLYETGESNGTVSLSDLKNNDFRPSFSDKTIYDYAYYICRGGWPLAINRDRDISLAQAKDYYEVVVTDDIFSLRDIPLRRDEQKARKLMRSYARNISIPAADETLREDCASGDETFDKDKVNKQISETFDNSVVNEIHIYGCLPKSYNIEEKCYLGFLDAKYDIEANPIHQIFVNCIEFWFKHELGLKIKVSSLENEDDEKWTFKCEQTKKILKE